jgi:hypothetical protein
VTNLRYRSRDDLTIHGYLTLPVGRPAQNLACIVNPHGVAATVAALMVEAQAVAAGLSGQFEKAALTVMLSFDPENKIP